MKYRVIIPLGLVVAALVSCQGVGRQSAAARPNAIKVDEHSVLIPGTAISEDDQAAVNNIFKKYDSSLYRIAVYENGSLKKQLGKMSEMQIGAIASDPRHTRWKPNARHDRWQPDPRHAEYPTRI